VLPNNKEQHEPSTAPFKSEPRWSTSKFIQGDVAAAIDIEIDIDSSPRAKYVAHPYTYKQSKTKQAIIWDMGVSESPGTTVGSHSERAITACRSTYCPATTSETLKSEDTILWSSTERKVGKHVSLLVWFFSGNDHKRIPLVHSLT
jgi:hypothetical protein